MIRPFRSSDRRPRPVAGKALRPSIEALEGRALLTAIGIDPTYGIGGEAIPTIPTGNFSAGFSETQEAVAVQADGKAVAAGRLSSFFGEDFAGDLLVTRFNADGSPDTSFGLGGNALVPMSAPDGSRLDSRGVGLVIQADGKIVVLADTNRRANSPLPDPFVSPVNDFAVARLNPDGTIDTSFAGVGYRLIDFGPTGNLSTDSDDFPTAIALATNGQVVVVGTTSSNTSQDMAVARLNADGSLDSSFGGDGKVTIPFDVAGTQQDQASDVVVQPDAKVVVVGSAVTIASVGGDLFSETNNIAVARLNADGSLDSSFDGDGKVTIGYDLNGDRHDSGLAVALQGDKIVVAGSALLTLGDPNSPTSRFFSNLTLTRLNPNGSLDASFDGDGKSNLSLIRGGQTLGSSPTDVDVLGDGSLLVAGSYFNPNGTGGSGALLARFLPDGGLDPTYGDGGAAFLSNGTIAGDVALQPDGKVVFATFTGVSRTSAPAPAVVQADLTSVVVVNGRAAAISLKFNTALNPALATNAAGYRVRVGNRGRRFLAVRSVRYDPSTYTVTVILRKSPPRRTALSVILAGAAIVGLDGSALNGGNPLAMTVA